MKNRAMSEKFFYEFKSGKYQNILQTVKQDDDLIMCLRGDYITIYYKSMRILEISENGEYDVDKNYGIIPPNDDTNWIEYFKNAKFALNSYNKTKQMNKLEKEVQQAIVKENNTSSICNETDYFIIDIEYTQPEFDGRFDALAVYWPKNKRKNGHDLQLAFIEVKAGNNAIGGTSGIVKHYESVIEFLNNLTKNNEKEQFIQDIEKVIAQQRDLGLWNIPHNKHEITLSRSTKPQLIFILANYNQNSTVLRNELNLFPSINKKYSNELPFELKFATSSFVGYGLYSNGMINIDNILDKK